MSVKIFSIGNQGYVTIFMALLLLAVTIGAVSTVFFLSSSNSQSVQGLLTGEQALASSEACLEAALLRLKGDPTYNGGRIAILGADCAVDVENDGLGYIVRSQFLFDINYNRAVEAAVEFDGEGLRATSWREIPGMVE